MSAPSLVESVDWNALIARIDALEAGAPAHTLDSVSHPDVAIIAESEGMLLYWHDVGGFSWRGLPKGTDGQYLKSTATTIEWAAASGPHTLDSADHTDVNAMTEATGDIVYRTGSALWDRLGIGNPGEILTVVGGLPVWATPAGGAHTLDSADHTDVAAMTEGAGDIVYYDDYDAKWHNLGIGSEAELLSVGASGLPEWSTLTGLLDTNVIQRYALSMEPMDGATWDYTQGTAILINADNEKVSAEAFVPSGARKFRVKVWAEHGTSSDTTYIQLKVDGKATAETSLTNYYNNTSEWASTNANEAMLKDTGWQSITTTDERIVAEVKRITGGGTDPVYIHEIVIEFESQSFVLNTGSSALTDLRIPCMMEPYDNAAWSYKNGLCILLDLADEKVLAHGDIPPDSINFRIHVWYQHAGASNSSNLTTTIKGQELDTTTITTYITDTSAWASTSDGEQKVKTLGWYAVDADVERIFTEIKWNSGNNIYINAVIIECQTPLKAYANDGTSLAEIKETLPMQPYDEATWSFENGLAIHLNIADAKVLAVGQIPADTTNIKVHIWAQHDGDADSSNITTTVKGQECGTTTTTTYVTDTSAWTSTLTNEQICKTLGWYGTDADIERIFVEIKWNSGDDIWINAIVLECRTPINIYYVAATLSNAMPADMPAAGTGGTASTVSRSDHIHPFTDHVTCWMQPYAGSTWALKTQPCIDLLDAVDRQAYGGGNVRTGFKRYRVIFFYSASQNYTPTIWLSDQPDCTQRTWNRLEGDAQTFNAHASGIDYMTKWVSDWYTFTSPSVAHHIGWRIRKGTAAGNFYLFSVLIEFDTESS